jgi:tRNA A37 threonylcarbamoyltransferase TsaD
MLGKMCKERNARLYACPLEYSGDNGNMIAIAGMLAYNAGQKPMKKIDFNPKWRVDEVDVNWI